MDRRTERKAAFRMVLGFLVNVAALGADFPNHAFSSPTSIVLGLLSSACFISGGRYFMRAKARSQWWAALGIFGLPGFVAMLFVKDHSRRQPTPSDQNPPTHRPTAEPPIPS